MTAAPVTTGELLRWAITRAGLTQKDCADRALVSEQHLSRILAGRAVAGAGVLRELGRVVGVHPLVLAAAQLTEDTDLSSRQGAR